MATSVAVGCSDRKSAVHMISTDEGITMPDEVHGVDEKCLVQLKKKVRPLTNIISVVDVQLGKIIAELHELGDQSHGGPHRLTMRDNNVCRSESDESQVTLIETDVCVLLQSES